MNKIKTTSNLQGASPMNKNIANEISIRNQLQPGDLGYITYLHGTLYSLEYKYGIEFESYVAAGMHEFYSNYNPIKDRVWICEHQHKIVGCLFLICRDESTAQLRFFLLLPEYRGLGIGKKLMEQYFSFMKDNGYLHSYLWTTSELHEAAALYTRFGFILTVEKESAAFGKHVVEQKYEMKL